MLELKMKNVIVRKKIFVLSLWFKRAMNSLLQWFQILRHKSSSNSKQFQRVGGGGVHNRVPVIFRGSMLDKNPWTCWTSSRQGLGQRLSMCTHIKKVTYVTDSVGNVSRMFIYSDPQEATGKAQNTIPTEGKNNITKISMLCSYFIIYSKILFLP